MMRRCVVQRTTEQTHIAVLVQAFISIDLNYCKSALYGITVITLTNAGRFSKFFYCRTLYAVIPATP